MIIVGDGIIDGLGYDWWARDQDDENPYGRPNLLKLQTVSRVEIIGLRFLNSPQKAMDFQDVDDVTVNNIDVRTDLFRQFGWET